MICALFAWLFRPIDFRRPWTTTRARGGGPYLDELLARSGRPLNIPNPATGEPLRIGMYLELHRKETPA